MRSLQLFQTRIDADLSLDRTKKHRDYAEFEAIPVMGDLWLQRCLLGIIWSSALWVLCRCRHKTHWTRHPTRLDREFGRKRWGDDGYAREELVAELGAAFLCADLGLELQPRGEWSHAVLV